MCSVAQRSRIECALMCAQNQGETFAPVAPSQKISDASIIVMYPSWTMKNALVSLVNLLTLLVGIAIGILLAPHIEKPASALSQAPSVPSDLSGQPVTDVEQIQPSMTVGTLGAYRLLTHHIQSDELVVNGIDLLKLQEGELNLLARTLGVNPQDVQNVVNQARNTHLYQVGTPGQIAKPPAK